MSSSWVPTRATSSLQLVPKDSSCTSSVFFLRSPSMWALSPASTTSASATSPVLSPAPFVPAGAVVCTWFRFLSVLLLPSPAPLPLPLLGLACLSNSASCCLAQLTRGCSQLLQCLLWLQSIAWFRVDVMLGWVRIRGEAHMHTCTALHFSTSSLLTPSLTHSPFLSLLHSFTHSLTPSLTR